MTESKIYSARNVFEGLKKTFHQYLEAQYHIWDEGLIAERQRLLNQPGVCFQEPRLEATPSYTIGKSYHQLNIPQPAREILSLASNRPNVGIYREPYHHQAEALEKFLGSDEEVIVATGTGSGKTESFLMPILGALAIESAQRSKSWKTPGCRALLLYPMNALVNDQLARLRRLLGDLEIAQALKGDRDRLLPLGCTLAEHPIQGSPIPKKIGNVSESYLIDSIRDFHLKIANFLKRKANGQQRTSNALLNPHSRPAPRILNYCHANAEGLP